MASTQLNFVSKAQQALPGSSEKPFGCLSLLLPSKKTKKKNTKKKIVFWRHTNLFQHYIIPVTFHSRKSFKQKATQNSNDTQTALDLSKIKSSLYSPYYAEACNKLQGPSPRLSAWAAQLRRIVATVASHWRHCVDLTGPGIEPQTSRTNSVRLATELSAGALDL